MTEQIETIQYGTLIFRDAEARAKRLSPDAQSNSWRKSEATLDGLIKWRQAINAADSDTGAEEDSLVSVRVILSVQGVLCKSHSMTAYEAKVFRRSSRSQTRHRACAGFSVSRTTYSSHWPKKLAAFSGQMSSSTSASIGNIKRGSAFWSSALGRDRRIRPFALKCSQPPTTSTTGIS